MTAPHVLVSNIMMLKERDRFDAALREMGYVPVWAPDHVSYGQFMDEAQCLALAGQADGWLAGDGPHQPCRAARQPAPAEGDRQMGDRAGQHRPRGGG